MADVSFTGGDMKSDRRTGLSRADFERWVRARDVLFDERISHERELREAEHAAVDHEREMRAAFDAHERELRTTNETAVEKARQLQFEVYEERLHHMNEFRSQLTSQAGTFLTIERFDREHKALVDRYEREASVLQEKVQAQEKVTIRQDTTSAVLEGMASSRRWLVGLAVASLFSIVGVVITLITLVTHLGN